MTAGLTLCQEKYSRYWGSPRESDALVLCNHRLGGLDLVNSSCTDLGSKEKTSGPVTITSCVWVLGVLQWFPHVRFLLRYVSAAEQLGL